MNRNIEIFNKYKDRIKKLKLWEYKPLEEPFVLCTRITDKEKIEEMLKEINPNEIVKISSSDNEMDIDFNRAYFEKLTKGKNLNIFVV